MIQLPRTGYRSRNLFTDIALGLTDGLDMSLWCYVCASIIFVGAFSIYLPVGILAALMGWVLLSLTVTFTSREPVHIANLDEQAMVIFGAISALMSATMGDDAASPRGLATLLFIIATTSFGFAASCYLIGRYRLSRVLELMPFPVICGFMASVGWLLIGAGVEVASDVPVSTSLITQLEEGNRQLRLGLAAGLGGVLVWATYRFEHSWVLPVLSIAIVMAYYLVMEANGVSHSEQLTNGWLFQITDSEGGVAGIIATLSPSDIDWHFAASVIPQAVTIIFLATLYASLSLTALKANSSEKLNLGVEFSNLSSGNLLCAGVCSPPGSTDVVATTMYKKLGASSRWMPLTSSMVGMLIAIFGGWIISYLPKLLMSATIFLFAFQTLHGWVYRNVRGFSDLDYSIVWIILGTTIFAGFMQGIGVGIILTVMLFVFRYSRITAIQSRSTLREQRSSVERSSSASQALQRDGSSVVIYSLRGFLFFGTANSILDQIAEQENLHHGHCRAILMDMKRVTGMDISALNTFAQIRKLCDAHDVLLLYSGVPSDMKAKLLEIGAVSMEDERDLLFDRKDFAVEYLENRVLRNSDEASGYQSIHELLSSMIGDQDKVEILLQAMQRVDCKAGETLFTKGDPDSGLYILGKGSLSAYIPNASGQRIRVKKFSPGSLVGELSAYLIDKFRTATVVADEDSTIYHLDTEKLQQLGSENLELRACIHELVATTLAERVSFMNNRLAAESS